MTVKLQVPKQDVKVQSNGKGNGNGNSVSSSVPREQEYACRMIQEYYR